MSTSESTCWTVIRAAATGSPTDREEMARRYLGIVRAYLASRWNGSTMLCHLDDAVQETFVECFRQDGVLDAAGAGRVPNFRPFLYGVIRHIALRFECRQRPLVELPVHLESNEASQSRLFDRTWAGAIMAEAARLQRDRASASGPDAVRRVELLRLRFEENLPIRTIAEQWGVEAAGLHHAYALARKEFRAALLKVISFHSPGHPESIEVEAAGLLKALS